MSGLVITNVHKSFAQDTGSIKALSGVFFTVPPGALKVLLGRSGSGKTTLLRLCAGHEKPDSGSIRFGGADVHGASPERFMVFQAFDQLYPWLRVKQNIVFALRAVNKKLSRAQAAEHALFWLRETGLDGFENMWPMELSGGMKQRAALARAFAICPQLLLLDEPFAALDAVLRKSMQTLTKTLCEKHGVSAFFVTHDIDEALFLDASPAVLIPDGTNIVTIGSGGYVRQKILELLEKLPASEEKT